MAIRRATAADARFVRDQLAAFFDQRGIEYRPQTVARMRDRFRYNVVWVQDARPRAFAMLRFRRGEIEVAGLFPRGMARSRLRPLLVGAFQDIAQRFPQALSARVWAEFPFTDDLGEGECLAWQSELPAGVLQVLQSADGPFVIESTLGQLI